MKLNNKCTGECLLIRKPRTCKNCASHVMKWQPSEKGRMESMNGVVYIMTDHSTKPVHICSGKMCSTCSKDVRKCDYVHTPRHFKVEETADGLVLRRLPCKPF